MSSQPTGPASHVDAGGPPQAEAALREREQFFRLLTESASDFVRLHDLAGRNVYSSPSIRSLYGDSLPNNLFDLAHPDDHERATRWWESVLAGSEELLNWRVRARDGEWRWLESRGTTVSYHGAPHVLTTCRDVTERKQAEEEHRAHLWFLGSLDRVNCAIQGSNDVEQMMRDVLDVVLDVFDADQAALLFPCDPDASAWAFTTVRTRAHAAGALAAESVVPRTPGAVAMFQALREADGPLAFGPGNAYPIPDVSRVRGAQSLLATCIAAKGDRPHAFGVDQTTRPRVWSAEEQRLFQEIGRRLADALTVLSTVQRLRDSQARLDEAERIAHVGYWQHDLDADRITWSDETYRILGLVPQESPVGMAEFQARIHPDDRQSQAEASARAQRGDGQYEVEYRVVRPDGEVRIIHSVGDVIRDASGQSRRAFGVVQDVTERKQVERAVADSHSLLHAVVDGTADSIYVKDLQGRYLLVNAACARSHGKPVEEIVGGDDWTLFPPELARAVIERDRAVLESGEPQTFEETLTTAGLTRTYVTTKSVYRDAHGRVLGLVGISSDVTELKQLEAQFRQAQKMEAVGQLAGGVAHDFNNLLTIITGYGSLHLAELPPDAASRAEVEEILTAAQRGAGLTRQLLAFSRQQVLQPRLVDLNQSVTTTVGMLRRVIGEDITLQTELAPNVWPVHADPGQLEQVVMNLAVNARDAMPHGGTLRLRTANADADAARARPGLAPGQYATLMVEDTGTGIDPAVLPHLFEPFFTTKGPGKGTGLGLATVFGIVKQSGGDLSVESAPGQGSRFTVYLPRHLGEPERESDRAPAAPPRGTETILLVEDEGSVRTATRRMLERLGYRVLDAAGGAEALDHVAQADARGERIDLVLTDVVMPEQGGRALGERLAERWPGLRVLYMSGYTDDEILRRGLVVSGVTFLEKPFTPTRLGEVVRRVLDRASPSPRV